MKLIPTLIVLVILIALVSAGCSDTKTSIKHGTLITGVSVLQGNDGEKEMIENETSVDTLPGDIEYEKVYERTTSKEKITTPFKCNEEKVFLGYSTCYNLSKGEEDQKVEVVLKNIGRVNITKVWFNIDVYGTSYYESGEGVEADNYIDYVLDITRFREDYGDFRRILIIPQVKTVYGERSCPNRQLLLLPEVNCH